MTGQTWIASDLHCPSLSFLAKTLAVPLFGSIVIATPPLLLTHVSNPPLHVPQWSMSGRPSVPKSQIVVCKKSFSGLTGPFNLDRDRRAIVRTPHSCASALCVPSLSRTAVSSCMINSTRRDHITLIQEAPLSRLMRWHIQVESHGGDQVLTADCTCTCTCTPLQE